MAYSEINRGAIWGNKRKETERHPDFTGSINVEGVEYWISAWKRKADAPPNAPALSFQVRLKDETPQKTAKPAQVDVDEDLPF